MELKFTFEDGSSGYLAHYGVKGMKWKDHVVQQEDEQKKARKAKRLRTIQNAMSQAVSSADARKAKARVKAHFAKMRKQGRKLRGTYSEFVVNANGTATSTLAKDRKNW